MDKRSPIRTERRTLMLTKITFVGKDSRKRMDDSDYRAKAEQLGDGFRGMTVLEFFRERVFGDFHSGLLDIIVQRGIEDRLKIGGGRCRSGHQGGAKGSTASSWDIRV